jgi:hypothetical protein
VNMYWCGYLIDSWLKVLYGYRCGAHNKDEEKEKKGKKGK